MSKEQESAESFGVWAPTYDEECSKEVEFFAGVTHDEVLDTLLKIADVRAGDRILDVGTGTGWAAIRCALQREDSSVFGRDMTSGMLTQVRTNEESVGLPATVQLTQGSAMRLPTPYKHFDLAMSSLALHHMMVPVAIGEMVRTLKPGGRLAIADMGIPQAWRLPPMSWLLRLAATAYGMSPSPQAKREADSFYHMHTVSEWRDLFQAKGLQNVQVTGSLRRGHKMLPIVIYSYGEKPI